MRITGGTMRGRVLRGKVGRGVRPTTSRVREAVFSMVGQDLAGWTVLDAFGGSGLLGFEALSRGAALTTCERDRETARQIRISAAELGIEFMLRVRDVTQVFQSGVWDLVLLDPPYEADPLPWAEMAAPATGKVLVVEHRPGVEWPDRLGGLVLDKVRRHGDSALAIFRAGPDPSSQEADVVGDDAAMVEDEGLG